MKKSLLAVTGAFAFAAVACNALVGLDAFEKDPCAHGCDDGGADADSAIPDAGDAASDVGPPIVPIPDGAAAVSWAQWPMPTPGDGSASFLYTHNVDKSVTDDRTSLVWLPSKTAPFAADLAGFDAARAYCASLGDGGITWRLPTRIELVTLIDYSRQNPAVDPGFVSPPLKSGWYWSASVVRPPAADYQFWSVNFATGEVSDHPPSDPRTALCVRGQ